MLRGTNDARRRRPFSGAPIKRRGGEKGEERKADGGESAASENIRKRTGTFANPRLKRPKVVVKAGQKVKQPGVTL